MTIPAPYPPDTRARGWRYELDYERIRQSDTWALAGPEARPWLLMLWLVAWEQTPCGSLPGDEALIAARIEMPPKLWAKHRAVLLRGWELADDGRRYHRVLTERVIEMMEARRRESDRKALARARKAAGEAKESGGSPTDVPRDNHGTPTGLHPESDTGTGTGTGTYVGGEYNTTHCDSPRAPATDPPPPDDPPPKDSPPEQQPPPRPSAAAQVCIALRAAGVADVNPGHPRLQTLLEAGATAPEFVGFVDKAREVAPGREFAYVLGAVEGARTRAAAAAPGLHRGPMPAGPPRTTESARDRAARKRMEAFAPSVAVKADTFTEVVDVVARSVG